MDQTYKAMKTRDPLSILGVALGGALYAQNVPECPSTNIIAFCSLSFVWPVFLGSPKSQGNNGERPGQLQQKSLYGTEPPAQLSSPSNTWEMWLCLCCLQLESQRQGIKNQSALLACQCQGN